MELYQLNQFLAVARLGNISKAAEEIHTLQPALSRTIKMLEEELEVPLFTRTKNTIALNEYGQLAQKYAQKISDGCEEMKSELLQKYKAEHVIKIASCAPAPLWTLPELLKKCYPTFGVESELEDISQILAGLKNKTVQIGIFAGKVEDDSYVCLPCGSEQLYFSAPKNHPLAKRKSVTFSEIDGETMLLFSDIGFWHSIHEKHMPHSRFLLQNQRDDFTTLIETSKLPCFSTDITQKNGIPSEDRVDILITDKDAFAQYYAVCSKKDYSRFREFFEAI
jgi:DNA-binding transcriptional LysR family regulator